MGNVWRCRGCGGECYGREGHKKCAGCADADLRDALSAARAEGRALGFREGLNAAAEVVLERALPLLPVERRGLAVIIRALPLPEVPSS